MTHPCIAAGCRSRYLVVGDNRLSGTIDSGLFGGERPPIAEQGVASQHDASQRIVTHIAHERSTASKWLA